MPSGMLIPSGMCMGGAGGGGGKRDLPLLENWKKRSCVESLGWIFHPKCSFKSKRKKQFPNFLFCSCRAFFSYVFDKTFIKVALFLKTSPALKNFLLYTRPFSIEGALNIEFLLYYLKWSPSNVFQLSNYIVLSRSIF